MDANATLEADLRALERKWEQVGYYWVLLTGASIGLVLLTHPLLTPVVVVALVGLYLCFRM